MLSLPVSNCMLDEEIHHTYVKKFFLTTAISKIIVDFYENYNKEYNTHFLRRNNHIKITHRLSLSNNLDTKSTQG